METDLSIHAREKLWLSVHALATGRGRIHERMLLAARCLMKVSDKGLPDDIVRRRHSLISKLTSQDAVGDKKPLETTLEGMDEEEVVAIAKDICDLWSMSPDAV